MSTTEPPGQPEPLVMPQDEFDALKTVAEAAGEQSWTPEQIAEFRERFAAAMANPGPLRVLPRDLTDTERIEAAAAVLERRYPGTRPDTLDFVISELQSLARAWRRIAGEASRA